MFFGWSPRWRLSRNLVVAPILVSVLPSCGVGGRVAVVSSVRVSRLQLIGLYVSFISGDSSRRSRSNLVVEVVATLCPKGLPCLSTRCWNGSRSGSTLLFGSYALVSWGGSQRGADPLVLLVVSWGRTVSRFRGFCIVASVLSGQWERRWERRLQMLQWFPSFS